MHSYKYSDGAFMQIYLLLIYTTRILVVFYRQKKSTVCWRIYMEKQQKQIFTRNSKFDHTDSLCWQYANVHDIYISEFQ